MKISVTGHLTLEAVKIIVAAVKSGNKKGKGQKISKR